ncbi:MAG: hypothetical protein JRI72_10430 [Deltaproteobacteria bacterium]|nr:hypothetical protein [Deltaproteobacteria bacterium]
MKEPFTSIIYTLIQPKKGKDTFSIFDPTKQLDEKRTDKAGIAQSLNAAFLIALADRKHPESKRAKRFLTRMRDSSEWANIATFYLNGIGLVHREIEGMCKKDPNFSNRLKTLSEWMSNKENLNNAEETIEKIWSVFFPEGNDILANKQERIKALRAKRTVTITELNATPITDPAQQMLFTSNVLLTIPSESESLNNLPLSDHLKEKLPKITSEPQVFSYDHPVQLGIDPEKTEVLYGLRGLETAFEFECDRGAMSCDAKPICVLSVSVTHRGLRNIAKSYLEELFFHSESLKNIDVYVFTEIDTQRIIDEILAPAAMHYLRHNDAKELLSVFGVDGEYGRHYSFLKAVAAFWCAFIQPKIKATFKIDLDQVFPQKELVEQTGNSIFEHFRTQIWGARCLDSNGQPSDLGMIAGALVNQQDIEKSLFTPDVPFPNSPLSPDEYIFFSTLPQALSTEAEMMTRYTKNKLYGKRTCIQRIHVTGGTNGILIDSLRRYRPFTPSFIGRAEDQAYILSVLTNSGTRLGYVHKDGLIMRHDKEVFAQEAIQSSYISKIVGDYIRILYFSAYANVLTNDVAKLKDTIDPFTGCFISKIPASVTYLRFGLKAASFFAAGEEKKGFEFIKIGAQRIMDALDFVHGENSMLKQRYEKERLGWNLYYDILSAVEDALKNNDSFALELRKKAETIIYQCYVKFGSK